MGNYNNLVYNLQDKESHCFPAVGVCQKDPTIPSITFQYDIFSKRLEFLYEAPLIKTEPISVDKLTREGFKQMIIDKLKKYEKYE